MAVDTTIQFNGHNSYKVTELLLAYPFGVQGMTYITHSFQVYCNSPLASATRAKTKLFDADGATLSEVSHAFAVPAVFEKIEITVPVPATAVQAQLVFLHGGTDWWFAEPKSEEGQSATPYNVNYVGQLTYITPNGIYTGMMTTGQIVVTGSVASPDETLDTRLVTINNGVINLSSTLSAKTTKITNEGVYTGEVRADQITVGQIQGPQLADGSVSNIKVTSGLSAGKITVGKMSSVDGKTWFDLDKPEIVQMATISGKSVKVEMSPTNPFKLSIWGNTGYQDYIYVTDASGFSGPNILVTSKYDVNEDGVVDEKDLKLIMDYIVKRDIAPGVPWPQGYPVARMDFDQSGEVHVNDLNACFAHASISDKLTTAGGDRQVAIDSTGVYTTTDGGATKVYRWTF